MKKTLKIVGGVVAGALILIAYLYYGVSHMPFPWKVIDPHDPRFVAEDFRFEDYYGRDGSTKLQEALRVMFPIGTPKEKVDKILYENQPKYTENTKWGAWVKHQVDFDKQGEKNVYYYCYSPRFFPINKDNIQVYFDESNKVKEVSDHGVPLFNKTFYGDK